MSSAIQFYGLEQVIQAAENRKCPKWGIFQLRQFLFKYEEEDLDGSLAMLQQTLECIAHSTATYTIKFYEPDGSKTKLKIKENTPCDGSFNFKLVSEEERNQRQMIYQANSPKVLETLGRIEERLNALESGSDLEEEEEEPADLQHTIMGYIQQPQKLAELAQALNSIKGLLGFPVQQVPNYIGTIKQAGQIEAGAGLVPEDPLPELSQEQNEQEIQRLGAAIDTLQRHDKKIVEHLEKLARMAENNPQQFTGLISMLDIMQ